MASKVVELATKVDELKGQYFAAVADLMRELKGGLDEGTESEQVPQRPARQTTRSAGRPANTSSGATGDKQPSLKEVVLTILRNSQNGFELRDIVREVTRMREAGEYKTQAKSTTAIVSQALNQLKQDKLVAVEKSQESNRNIYTVAAAAA